MMDDDDDVLFFEDSLIRKIGDEAVAANVTALSYFLGALAKPSEQTTAGF
jgi:hypothetical protein